MSGRKGTAMNQRDATLPIPDVQSSPDTRQLAIDRVGIKAIRHR
jgi:GTP cyclohydrolase I